MEDIERFMEQVADLKERVRPEIVAFAQQHPDLNELHLVGALGLVLSDFAYDLAGHEGAKELMAVLQQRLESVD